MTKKRSYSSLTTLAVFAAAITPSFAGVIAVAGQRPPASFTDAVTKAGSTVSLSEPASNDAAADVLMIATGPGSNLSPTVSAQVSKMLAAGKTVIVTLGGQLDAASGLEPLLPVNSWSIRSDQYVRLSSGILSNDTTAFPAADLNSLTLTSRFDLHLPYAPVESGEHRYKWQQMDKDLLNTDWHVLLTSDQDGRLPLLIEGRVGPGKVFIFGANLFDTSFSASPKYAGFIQELLTRAQPLGVKSSPALDAKTIRIAVPRLQSNGLSVQVSNDGTRDADVLLAYKIGSAEHQLLNSATVPVTVPAGKTISVPLVERSPEFGAHVKHSGGDDALSYRWIHVGVAAPDRTAVLTEKMAIVDTAPAVTMAISGADIRFMPDKATWPDRELGAIINDSGPMMQYAAQVGSSIPLTVTLSNGLHDLSPLALPSDSDSTNALAAQGLNDLSYSHGNVRGKLPLVGFWSTKSTDTATVRLAWDSPVTVASQVLYGQTSYRFWDRANPVNYSLIGENAGTEKPLTKVTSAAYTEAQHQDEFAPQTVTACSLQMSGLKTNQLCELGSAAIAEWSVLGWPGTTPPPSAKGQLHVTLTDLTTGTVSSLADQSVQIAALTQQKVTFQIPARQVFGPVAIDAVFTAPGMEPIHSHYDLLYVDDHKALKPNPHSSIGLLCAAGMSAMNPFGTGTHEGTTGWVGPENGIWAGTHDMMEISSHSVDLSNRMFTTSVRFSHYTNPWRNLPSGEYYWDTLSDKVVQIAGQKASRDAGTANIFLADRWNGIPTGANFTWSDYIAFDAYLRGAIGHGLKSRSRVQINKEITSEYADLWQRWLMDRYANKLIELQKTVATKDNGVRLTVTTHGSFPLVGGDLGHRVAETHTASGTDVFWELHGEDLYKSLGSCFGLIGANPDFESGAYNEWGWNSSALNNDHWFGYVGSVEPARRQWYSTYFLGRVTTPGAFDPLTVFGFYAQGGFGPKMTHDDMQTYYRVMRFTTRVRPEKAAGYGLVVSWNEQVRHLGKQAGQLGTGLYAAQGYPQIDALAGTVEERLAKNGVPIGFVASTDTLAKWQGTQPLIAADGLSFNASEITTLSRINVLGTPVIAIGGVSEATSQASHLFGVRCVNGVVSAVAGTTTVPIGGGAVCYVTHRAGHGATLFCPVAAGDLDGATSASLAKALLSVCGNPMTISPGIVVNPFVNHGALFLALGDQSDVSRTLDLSVDPTRMASGLQAESWRVIDVDRGETIPSTMKEGKISFTIPSFATDGHMLMLVPSTSITKKVATN